MEVLNPRKPKEPKKIGRAPKYSLEVYMMMAKQVVEQEMSYREENILFSNSYTPATDLFGRMRALLEDMNYILMNLKQGPQNFTLMRRGSSLVYHPAQGLLQSDREWHQTSGHIFYVEF